MCATPKVQEKAKQRVKKFLSSNAHHETNTMVGTSNYEPLYNGFEMQIWAHPNRIIIQISKAAFQEIQMRKIMHLPRRNILHLSCNEEEVLTETRLWYHLHVKEDYSDNVQ
jgi:hypothetical protein